MGGWFWGGWSPDVQMFSCGAPRYTPFEIRCPSLCMPWLYKWQLTRGTLPALFTSHTRGIYRLCLRSISEKLCLSYESSDKSSDETAGSPCAFFIVRVNSQMTRSYYCGNPLPVWWIWQKPGNLSKGTWHVKKRKAAFSVINTHLIINCDTYIKKAVFIPTECCRHETALQN